MRITSLAPETTSLEECRNVDPSIPSLGSQHGADPSMHYPKQLVVLERIFSFYDHSYMIKTSGGTPFGHNLKTRGNAHDQMVLLTGRNTPVAVCIRKSGLFGQTFKIYATRPLYPGQRSSARKYNKYTLYSYANVERKPLSTRLDVTFDGKPFPSYTVHRARGLWPTQKRVVKRHGHPAAFMEGRKWQGHWDSCMLTINPGIDPCLVVCLFAICDEIDGARK